jgi:hypothetical protein
LKKVRRGWGRGYNTAMKVAGGERTFQVAGGERTFHAVWCWNFDNTQYGDLDMRDQCIGGTMTESLYFVLTISLKRITRTEEAVAHAVLRGNVSLWDNDEDGYATFLTGSEESPPNQTTLIEATNALDALFTQIDLAFKADDVLKEVQKCNPSRD